MSESASVAVAELPRSIVPESPLAAKVIRQQPVRIDTLLTKTQFVSLVRHMLNGNPVSHFLTVWKDEERGREIREKGRVTDEQP